MLSSQPTKKQASLDLWLPNKEAKMGRAKENQRPYSYGMIIVGKSASDEKRTVARDVIQS